MRLAGGTGLAKFGTLSVDGAKVRANASKRKATGYARMKEAERRLEAEISELPGRAGSADADEDGRFGADARGDEAEGLAEDKRKRLEAIRAAKARLEAREREAEAEGSGPPREPDGKAQSNFTDPESGIMPTSSEGFQQCYNAGVAVAGDGQLIVATEVRASPSDQGTMLGLVDKAEAVCGEAAGEVLADAGFRSERDLAELEKRGIDGQSRSSVPIVLQIPPGMSSRFRGLQPPAEAPERAARRGEAGGPVRIFRFVDDDVESTRPRPGTGPAMREVWEGSGNPGRRRRGLEQARGEDWGASHFSG